MAVYLLFIDGVGLGDSAEYNPWYTKETLEIRKLLWGNPLTREAIGSYGENQVLLSIDACLQVPGIPQSATGQATIFTGRNASKAMGQHQSGLPGTRLKEWIQQQNHLYYQIRSMGKSVTFANSYTPDFYERPATKRGLLSVTTILAKSLDEPLRTYDDLLDRNAVYHDLTREFLQNRLPSVPLISPEQAAEDFIRLGTNKDVVVHEFFLSDQAGHKYRKIPQLMDWVIPTYDRFLGYVVSGLRAEDWLILVSDHGNSEDLRISTHTENRVPLLLIGPGANKKISNQTELDLTMVAPLICDCLQDKRD